MFCPAIQLFGLRPNWLADRCSIWLRRMQRQNLLAIAERGFSKPSCLLMSYLAFVQFQRSLKCTWYLILYHNATMVAGLDNNAWPPLVLRVKVAALSRGLLLVLPRCRTIDWWQPSRRPSALHQLMNNKPACQHTNERKLPRAAAAAVAAKKNIKHSSQIHKPQPQNTLMYKHSADCLKWWTGSNDSFFTTFLNYSAEKKKKKTGINFFTFNGH